MPSSASLLGYEMRDALWTAFSAEMHAGGKLANLVNLRKSKHLAQNAVVNPSDVVGGIQMLGHSPPRPYEAGGLRRREVDVKFEILLAARSQRVAAAPGMTGRIAILDDALETLRPVIDDGNGRGVIGMLNNPSIFGIPVSGVQLVMQSTLGEGRFYEDIEGEGADQSVWGIYVVDYIATGLISS